MAGRRDEPAPFERDQKFDEDLHRFNNSDPKRAKTLAERCEQIRRNPFKGEWKKWAMDGLYGLHAGEQVILYELEPDLPPNGDPEDVEEVYFWRIVHHDDQQQAVKNIDRVGSARSVSIRLEYETIPNLQAYASELREAECFLFKADQYDAEGLSITGELPDDDDAERELRDLIPDSAYIEIEEPTVADIIEE